MLYNFGDTITKISNDPSQILAFIMMQMPMLITFYIASYFFKAVKTIYNIKFSKNNFGINNQEFLNKYYISESKDENAIRRVFTSEICEKILKFKPELLGISSHGNCILSRSEGKINSVSICKKLLNNIISQAKIFKQEDTL